MLLGPRKSGRSNLASWIGGTSKKNLSSQEVLYGENTIDVPASFLENHWMYRHVIAIAQNQAAMVLMLVPQALEDQFYSPQFAQVFTCPVVGVITQVPKGEEASQRAIAELSRAGIAEPFHILHYENEDDLILLQHRIEQALRGDRNKVHN